jgi:23S rRNA (uracil1939-C5)-methyltransferase
MTDIHPRAGRKPGRPGKAPPRRGPAGRAAPTDSRTLTIDVVGAKGDGLARDAAGDIVAVPHALPGEIVEAAITGGRGRLERIMQASPERATPPCPHFGVCGGCALQHWAEAAQLAWKGAQVTQALARRGVAFEVGPARAAWGAGRRRAGFHAVRKGEATVFGFAQARSHALVDVRECPILTPGLQTALPRLRTLAEGLAPRNGEPIGLAVTETRAGLDVDVTGAGRMDAFARRGLERLAGLVEAAGLARLTLHGETALMREPPSVRIGSASVALPPGAFLQATHAGEEALSALVLEWTDGAKVAADLFAGLGTFALRLKERAAVRAHEGDAAAVAALKRAADAMAGGHALTAETRDLFRAPVAPLELKGVEALVFDPPRAGAAEQVEQIVRAKVPVVVAVSCDPATFARDARTLIDGGFALDRVVALDQFRFSPHVEVAARFSRG